MTVTTKEPLGADTLNRKWYLDVNAGTTEAPDWVGIFGMTEFKPSKDPTSQDSSDFDSEGWKSSTVTALGWGAEGKLKRSVRRADATAYDPGQEILRAASDGMGTDNSVEIRYYEVTPGGPQVEAYQGFVSVEWTPDGGGMDALDMVSFKLNGQGKRNVITHPGAASVAAPTVTGLAPAAAAAAGGLLIVVSGTNFNGATAVHVDVTNVNATDWEVITPTKIALKVPAHAAGIVDVTVTTPGGTSGTSASSKLTYS
ncbi:phage tail tube protein [Aeromicrobium sp. 9AM]|uniref:phage tail tube protein n=1 Tax=Aeromicrobium sp. 9AM TaxID=2653126 RepID=UPI0012F1A1F9|nr:IPT/TIG domain-containing protein [Aeromicrobium sp. 9AM]VXB81942.1 conserved hypothetical protein [Aeromicrobium sp. 9AM]